MVRQTSSILLYSLVILATFVFVCCQGSPKVSAADKKASLSKEITWMSLEDAELAMADEAKDIFIMVYAKWCPICKKFDQTTYQDPKLIYDLNTKYYPVKLNAHSSADINYRSTMYSNPNFDPSKAEDEVNAYHEIVYALKAGSIPSIVFVDKNFNLRGTEMGYKPAEELRSLLSMYQSQ